MIKFPSYLKSFNNQNLVDFRRYESYDETYYLICDKKHKTIARADTHEMAEFITNCINKVYKDEIITKNNGKRMGETINKFSKKGTVNRNQ